MRKSVSETQRLAERIMDVLNSFPEVPLSSDNIAKELSVTGDEVSTLLDGPLLVSQSVIKSGKLEWIINPECQRKFKSNVFKSLEVSPEKTYCLGAYLPWDYWNKKQDGKWDEFSKEIHIFNDRYHPDNHAIANKFENKINDLLDGGFSICVVPSSSHLKKNVNRPIGWLAISLAKSQQRVDATSCLQRTYTIPKVKWKGSPRGREIHLLSIEVMDSYLIWGKNVLLIDDIKTTGNSISACRELLLKAGASQVWSLVLGETTRDINLRTPSIFSKKFSQKL